MKRRFTVIPGKGIVAAMDSSRMTPNNIRNAIRSILDEPSDKAIDIIYQWYDAEDAFSDFSTVEEFRDYLNNDIADMLDVCTDETEYQIVAKALGIDIDSMKE